MEIRAIGAVLHPWRRTVPFKLIIWGGVKLFDRRRRNFGSNKSKDGGPRFTLKLAKLGGAV